jgi:hypothetical protein
MSERRYIDFISAYCDSWCERCAFTGRCSAYAIRCARAMCDGNDADAIDLALAAAREPEDAEDEANERSVQRPCLEQLQASGPTEEEMNAIEREHDALDRRVDRMPIMQLARAYSMLTYRWLREHRAAVLDPVVTEALEIVAWDQFFITVKLHRALSGREQGDEDIVFDGDPIQTDANGSAKVALISIERSEAAWRALAVAVEGDTPAIFADQLAQLRADVDAEFPHARAFRRPGFDP